MWASIIQYSKSNLRGCGCFLCFPFSSADLWVLTEKRKRWKCVSVWANVALPTGHAMPWCVLMSSLDIVEESRGITWDQKDISTTRSSSSGDICLLCLLCAPGRCPHQGELAWPSRTLCSASGLPTAAPLGPGSCPVWVASRAGSVWELLRGELRWVWQGTVQLPWEGRIHRSLWLERAFNLRGRQARLQS